MTTPYEPPVNPVPTAPYSPGLEYNVSFTNHEDSVVLYESNASVVGFGNIRWYPRLRSKIISMYIFYVCILLTVTSFIIHMNTRTIRNWANLPFAGGTHLFIWFWTFILVGIYSVIALIDLWFRDYQWKRFHTLKDSLFHATAAISYLAVVFYLTLSLHSRLTTSVGTVSTYVDDFIGYFLPAFFLYIECISLSHNFRFSIKDILFSCAVAMSMIVAFIIFSEVSNVNKDGPGVWAYEFQTSNNGVRLLIEIGCLVSIFVFHKVSRFLTQKLWPEFSFSDSTPFIN